MARWILSIKSVVPGFYGASPFPHLSVPSRLPSHHACRNVNSPAEDVAGSRALNRPSYVGSLLVGAVRESNRRHTVVLDKIQRANFSATHVTREIQFCCVKFSALIT